MTGISHMLEHAMFLGEPLGPRFTTRIQRLGGFTEAYTADSSTRYITRIHKAFLSEALPLEPIVCKPYP